jgi:hypothetical protein
MITAKKASEDKEIAEWLGPAFDQCALNLCSNSAKEQEVHIRNEFQRCRDEFCRIACDDIQVVHLRQDLYDLLMRGCPALDIVLLSLFYTVGVRRSRIDTLRENGITDSVLRKLKRSMAWSAGILEVLDNSAVLPPLDAREKQFIPQWQQQRAKPSIEALPDALRTKVKWLENSSICKLYPEEEAISENEFLVYLSLLLAGFGHKLPTLSRMLSAMRIVQHTGSPNDECLHKPVVVKSGKRKGKINDPFSEGALDTRLRRFSRDFPVVVRQMKWSVPLYTDAYAQHRESGETIFNYIFQQQKQDSRKTGPETDLNWLRGTLKLSDSQSAEILPILYELDRQALKILAPFLKRRCHISQSIVADANSNLEQIIRSTDAKIRRVLNSEQKKKFDRMQQDEERKLKRDLERMAREASRKL